MNSQITPKAIAEVLENIRETAPLVHNITNYVVMNNTANALLAIGASPIMAHAREEVKEMVSISSALVVNIGTLSPAWIEAMQLAVTKAKTLEKPWVLDPVGLGASQLRNETVASLLKIDAPTIVRGNASEIMGMAQQAVSSKGVDSTADTHEAVQAAHTLASTYDNTICVSGAVDEIISTGQRTQINNGSPLMAQVTGMGCTASAITGACSAVCDDSHLAATAAMAIMGISGDMAAEKAEGPGSFQMHFLDALHQLKSQDLTQRLRLENHVL